jgi:hypothetical protein
VNVDANVNVNVKANVNVNVDANVNVNKGSSIMKLLRMSAYNKRLICLELLNINFCIKTGKF